MSILNSLKLTTAKKPRHVPPIQIRRNKLSAKLWEQIQLARSQKDGTPFSVTKYKSVIDKSTGLRKQLETTKRIKSWWFVNEGGKLCVSIRYGTQVIELAKGKFSIEVANESALIDALETVKQAVEHGELDAQINSASEHARRVFEPRLRTK
jgi:hypothetical protein